MDVLSLPFFRCQTWIRLLCWVWHISGVWWWTPLTPRRRRPRARGHGRRSVPLPPGWGWTWTWGPWPGPGLSWRRSGKEKNGSKPERERELHTTFIDILVKPTGICSVWQGGLALEIVASMTFQQMQNAFLAFGVHLSSYVHLSLAKHRAPLQV